jgi:hypothetical protein
MSSRSFLLRVPSHAVASSPSLLAVLGWLLTRAPSGAKLAARGARRRLHRVLFFLPALIAFALASASPAYATEEVFGIESFSTSLTDQAEAPVTQAGAHPYAMTTTIVFNHIVEEKQVLEPGEEVPTRVKTYGDPKNVTANLPVGVIANPGATSTRCTEASLDEAAACPRSSAVGLVSVHVNGYPYRDSTPLYNMVPPTGVPGQFGANVAGLGLVFHISGKLRTGSDYGISGEVKNILRAYPIYAVSVTLWGDPSDPSHDAERGACGAASVPEKAKEKAEFEKENEEKGHSARTNYKFSCPVEPTETAFLTMPTSCAGESLVTALEVESWQGATVSKLSSSPKLEVESCKDLNFGPQIKVQPNESASSSPTGLHVELETPQNESVSGLAEPNLRDVVLTLPEGMTVNPAAAGGLAACPLLTGKEPEKEEKEHKKEIAGINLESNEPANCPNASKIGEVEVNTPLLTQPEDPLLDHVLKGSVYLAEQEKNPFGSLLAIYVAIADPTTGVVVKLAGHVELNEETGQLTTIFKDLPQIPFEDAKFFFFGGQRAPLVTPATCGKKTATTRLTPWSRTEAEEAEAPSENETPSATFEISENCGAPAFSPSFTAGTTNNQAAAYTPFVLSFARNDDEQDFRGLEETMPPGLLAKLTGVPRCGSAEAAVGNCPAASQIGTVQVAAGVGPDPVWVNGTVYLTGPYNGGPFGEVVEVPAIAGPFNLDENGKPVTIRGSIRINPTTAQATVVSDPFPEKLRGIPLHVRTVNVTLNRPEFAFNPTNCSPSSVAGTLTSTTEAKASVSSPFEAANCATLPFAPKLTASVSAKGSKANGVSFDVRLESAGIGQANIHKVDLQIPLALPSRLTTLQKACLAATFEANPASCSPESVIGDATVHTPLLNSPLSGPAYLVSHGGAAFPDAEFVLQGEGVTLVLDGKTDIKNGITYSKFETAPDAPFTSFEFSAPQGPFSIFGANGDLCQTEIRMPTTIVAQSGAVINQNTLVEPEGCPNAITILSHKVHKRTLTLKVAVPSAGKLTASGKGLTKASKTATGRSILTLTLKAKGHRKLKSKIKLTFAPSKGKKLTATTTAHV